MTDILAVDDRHKALEVLTESIHEADPAAMVLACTGGMEALSRAQEQSEDVAFIDIDMPEMDGITLARRLRLHYPRVNIVFATAYREYMGDAFDLRASGYVLKPITPEKVRVELENLRYQVKAIHHASDKRVYFHCFGNFDVFIDNKPVLFHYDKAKEMLAYLVDRWIGAPSVPISRLSARYGTKMSVDPISGPSAKNCWTCSAAPDVRRSSYSNGGKWGSIRKR